jgi:hypothetical protein
VVRIRAAEVILAAAVERIRAEEARVEARSTSS